MNADQFNKEVADATAALSLNMIDSISRNDMPECFETSRPLLVAMARMLITALAQNEIMIEQLKPAGLVGPDNKPIQH